MNVSFKDKHGNEIIIGSKIRITKHFCENLIGSIAKIGWDEKNGVLNFKIKNSNIERPFYSNFSTAEFELASINCKHNMVKTYEYNIAEIQYHCTKCDHTELE